MQPFITKPTFVNLDRQRRLRYTIGSIVTVEDLLEIPITNLPDWKDLPTAKLITLVWGGLLDEDPGITTVQIGQSSSFGDIPYIVKQTSKALGDSYSGERKEAKRGANPPLLAAA